MKVYGVVGWKNSGKTGLVTRLVAEFVARGFMVSTIKHAHHAFDVDHEGTDSFRHRAAGASEVMLTSGARWALMHELRDAPEPGFDDLRQRLSPVDLVLVEGYKLENFPKIEVHRAVSKADILGEGDDNVRAIASDCGKILTGRPAFQLDDTNAIADFIKSERQL